MKIARKSPVSGRTHVRNLPVTDEQMEKWKSGLLIQLAMPHLSHDDREFIKTGITPEEWNGLAKPHWTDDDDESDEDSDDVPL